MGDVNALHIVVTGAGGFLGRAICELAETRGHRVSRVVRSGEGDHLIDLAKPAAAADLTIQIGQADVVIHAASEMGGDWALHQRSSLPAMQTACDLAKGLGAHLVHISSIVVYDFMQVQEGGLVSETTQIELHPERRDGYVRAKLAQESIVAQSCPSASVLRIGALYGAGHVMNAHLGIGLGPVLLRLSARGQIPLAHITRAAQAALTAAERKSEGAVNILDDDLPDRIQFINALSASGWPKLIIPMPWQVFSAIGQVLAIVPKRPGLLRPPVLHARMKPLGFDTTLMSATLGDTPQPRFEKLLKQALRDD